METPDMVAGPSTLAGAAARAAGLRVTVARSVAELRTQAAAYQALLQRMPPGTIGPFYTLEWLEILAPVYVTPERGMHFLLAWQGDTLLGVAPMQLEQKSLSRGRVRRLFCWGNQYGSLMLEGNFLIPEPGDVDRCMAAFAAHVLDTRSGAVDCFEFHYLREDTPVFAAVQRHFRPQASEPEDMPSFQVRVPASFDTYTATLSTGMLAGVRNRWRALQKAGRVEFVALQELAPEDLEQVMQVHSARQDALRERGRTRQALFQDPCTRAAYLRLLEQTARDGSARHYLIRCDGKMVAFGLGYHYRGTWLFHLTGFVQEWGRFQPGRVLLYLMMQDLIGRGDTQLVDMLPGITKVKQDFSNLSPTYRCVSGTKTGSLRSRVKVGTWRAGVAAAQRWRGWRERAAPAGDGAGAPPGDGEAAEAGAVAAAAGSAAAVSGGASAPPPPR
jgi:CelD/BcsL family acetyltransferase involved in cellulose biosynthesis